MVFGTNFGRCVTKAITTSQPYGKRSTEIASDLVLASQRSRRHYSAPATEQQKLRNECQRPSKARAVAPQNKKKILRWAKRWEGLFATAIHVCMRLEGTHLPSLRYDYCSLTTTIRVPLINSVRKQNPYTKLVRLLYSYRVWSCQ